MRDDLMPVEIEIDPLIRAASLFALENASVEFACGIEIVDGGKLGEKVCH
jgi:hypothetical protein